NKVLDYNNQHKKDLATSLELMTLQTFDYNEDNNKNSQTTP
ncbi:15953_t:CDS:2, partial [Funneliformis geosporum]